MCAEGRQFGVALIPARTPPLDPGRGRSGGLRRRLLMTLDGRLLTVRFMDRADAVARLPVVHRAIIELLDTNTPDDEIARRLGLEPDAVGPVVTVARAKLDRLMDGTALPPNDGA